MLRKHAMGHVIVAGLLLCLVLGNMGAAAATRPVVTCSNGIVAAAHPLASQAGLQILMKGGNAVDAAVATAAVLNVVEPDFSSIAAGGVMLIYDAKTQKIACINANAPNPAGASIDVLTKDTAQRGYMAGMVPSALRAWDEALKNYGTMSLAEVLEPAIEYAERGFPITERLANAIANQETLLSIYPTSAKTFLPGGAPPKAGDVLVQSDLANTLKRVAKEGPDVFYKGEIAQEMADFFKKNGGLFTLEDFANYEIEWVEPLHGTYRGYDIYVPGGEFCGALVLQQLNIVEPFDLAKMGHNTVETLHLMVEATKLAAADRDRYIADPKFVHVPEKALISKEYAAAQRKRIDLGRAQDSIAPGNADSYENTTHISVVDGQGNMVSYTTSIGSSWGTGVVVGDTGVFLNNGGGWMEFSPDHVNKVEPHKRPMNNIAPVFVVKDGKHILNIGTPGGDAIWQTMFQLIVNVIDFRMDVQTAIEAPRYRIYSFGGNDLRLEARIPEDVRKGLEAKGHKIRLFSDWTMSVGGAQGVVVDPSRMVLMGGADPRRDGYVVGW
jgi:gamma-glutamyltranspeptidase/glutathione hydrolase